MLYCTLYTACMLNNVTANEVDCTCMVLKYLIRWKRQKYALQRDIYRVVRTDLETSICLVRNMFRSPATTKLGEMIFLRRQRPSYFWCRRLKCKWLLPILQTNQRHLRITCKKKTFLCFAHDFDLTFCDKIKP